MALPVSFDADLSVGPQNSYHGPFKSSGGNFYTVLRNNEAGDGTGVVSLHKATDPTSSFSELDSEIILGTDSAIPTIWCVQDGDTISIALQINPVNAQSVYYLSADISADTLSGEIQIQGLDTPDDGPDALACSIAVESTGSDLVVVYQGDPEMLMGTEYARIDANRSDDDGATWGGPISIDDGGNDHWTGPVIVLGSSDRMHIFFKNHDLDDLFQRRLGSDDSLETFPSAFNSGAGTLGTYNFGVGISYDDGGTQKVRCPYGTNSGSIRAGVAEFDSADTPSITDNTAVADNIPRNANLSYIVGMAVDGTDNHLMYSDNATSDLYRDLNDGTDTEVLDAVTINHVSPNVYDRSGTKLAYIYDDGGVVKYNEVGLAVAHTGTGAPEFEINVMTTVGVMRPDGVGALTMEIQELVAVGVMQPSGVGAPTFEPDVLAAVGEQPHEGVGALTMEIEELATVGAQVFAATGAPEMEIEELAAVGVQEFLGTGALNLEDEVLTVVGVMLPSATAAPTIETEELAAVGQVPFEGAGVLNFEPDVLAAVGEQPAAGTGAPTLEAEVLAAVGVMQPSATAAPEMQIEELATVGVEKFLGVGALDLENQVLTAVGEQPHEGVGAPELQIEELVAVGEQPHEGVGALELEIEELATGGLQVFVGVGALELAIEELTAVGVLQPSAVGMLELAQEVLTAAGSAGEPDGTATLILAPDTMTAVGIMPAAGVAAVTMRVMVLTSDGIGGAVAGGAFKPVFRPRRR